MNIHPDLSHTNNETITLLRGFISSKSSKVMYSCHIRREIDSLSQSKSGIWTCSQAKSNMLSKYIASQELRKMLQHFCIFIYNNSPIIITPDISEPMENGFQLSLPRFCSTKDTGAPASYFMRGPPRSTCPGQPAAALPKKSDLECKKEGAKKHFHLHEGL